jgi:VanZ family protein
MLRRIYHKKEILLTGFILWTLFIIAISSVPGSMGPSPPGDSGFRWDYLEHFSGYFIFSALYILWRGDRDYSIRGGELVLMITISIAFSFATEILQIFIPGRTFNIIDVIYNLAGVITGILIVYYYLVKHYFGKNLNS